MSYFFIIIMDARKFYRTAAAGETSDGLMDDDSTTTATTSGDSFFILPFSPALGGGAVSAATDVDGRGGDTAYRNCPVLAVRPGSPVSIYHHVLLQPQSRDNNARARVSEMCPADRTRASAFNDRAPRPNRVRSRSRAFSHLSAAVGPDGRADGRTCRAPFVWRACRHALFWIFFQFIFIFFILILYPSVPFVRAAIRSYEHKDLPWPWIENDSASCIRARSKSSEAFIKG